MPEVLSPDIFRKIRQLEIRTRGLVNNIFGGEYHSAFKGKGVEFAEVRGYQYGDDVRTIDWNVSARIRDGGGRRMAADEPGHRDERRVAFLGLQRVRSVAAPADHRNRSAFLQRKIDRRMASLDRGSGDHLRRDSDEPGDLFSSDEPVQHIDDAGAARRRNRPGGALGPSASGAAAAGSFGLVMP